MKKKGLTLLLVIVIVVIAETAIGMHFVNKWIDDGTLVFEENGKAAALAGYTAEMTVSGFDAGIGA